MVAWHWVLALTILLAISLLSVAVSHWFILGYAVLILVLTQGHRFFKRPD